MKDRADQIRAWLGCRADEMAGLLKELVAVDTENPPGRGLGACGSVLRDRPDVLQRQPAASTAKTHPAAVALARCVAEIEGEGPRFEMCPGAPDTRWYAQLGTPAFAYGAGRLDVSHGPEEFIDEAAMGRCAAVYARFAGEMIGCKPARA